MTNDYDDKTISENFDAVSKPRHYNSHPSGIETREVTGLFSFFPGNVIKYLWRSDLKGAAEQDVKKALWYTLAAIEQVEQWPKDAPGPCVVLPMMYDRALRLLGQVYAYDDGLLGSVALAFIETQPWDARRWLAKVDAVLVNHLGPEVAGTVSLKR